VPKPGATWLGRALVVATVVAAAVSLLVQADGMSGGELASSWQVLDLHALQSDPFGSLWYLHTQPPVHNMVVAVAIFAPAPIVGTLFVLYIVTLIVTGLLLHGLLVRWGLGPLAAGVVAALAMANPNLLGTIHIASYEVPVAMFVIGSLWAAQRYLDEPRLRWLLVTSGALTAGALTRSLLHPVWVLGILAALMVARPLPRQHARRHVAAALAIPLVLIGGWALKNEIVFGQATLSSWSGFNLQRGVVATMDRSDVEDAVADGDVSPLALQYPWGTLDVYEDVEGVPGDFIEPCRPEHDHAAVDVPEKDQLRGVRIANFNHECYLPLYDQASEDAVALVRRYPGRYLTSRGPALEMSFRVSYAGYDKPSTWMDALYAPLLGKLHTSIPMDDWNLPLLPGGRDLDVLISLTLPIAAAFVLGRGGLAAVRLARAGWYGRHEWPTGEVLWVLVTFTVGFVIVGGDLVEFGENSRFRTTIDPLLVALPLASLLKLLKLRSSDRHVRSEERNFEKVYEPEPASEPPAPPGPDSPDPADGRPTTAARSPLGPPG
jgi:hypothetical protein